MKPDMTTTMVLLSQCCQRLVISGFESGNFVMQVTVHTSANHRTSLDFVYLEKTAVKRRRFNQGTIIFLIN